MAYIYIIYIYYTVEKQYIHTYIIYIYYNNNIMFVSLCTFDALQWHLFLLVLCCLLGAWRTKEARRKKILLIRNKMEFMAARKLQGLARVRLATQKTVKLRRTVTMNKACTSIQRAFRCARGNRKMIDMLNSFHPHTILATMQSATMSSSTGKAVQHSCHHTNK
jgi:hypothetical protein